MYTIHLCTKYNNKDMGVLKCLINLDEDINNLFKIKSKVISNYKDMRF